MNENYQLTINQLQEIETASEGTLQILEVTEPKDSNSSLWITISLRLGKIPSHPAGIQFRTREKFRICTPINFPFVKPEVWVEHNRFAGYPHVQWKHYLCLYQAPDVEWDPSDGMYGFISRLWLWIKCAALDELDPVGAPLHPPAVYLPKGPVRYLIPRIDAPSISNSPWVGLIELGLIHQNCVEVIGWKEFNSPKHEHMLGVAILLSEPMPFEYPKKLWDLFGELEHRSISRSYLLLALQIAVLNQPEEQPLYVVLGTPMRGIRGEGQLQQHLTAWYIDPILVQAIRLSCNKFSDTEEVKAIGKEAEAIWLGWAKKADIEWCRVLEDRPEIVTRRDYNSPLSHLRGQIISIWGCGAIGAHIALYLARAGVKKLILIDKGIVTPGILIRQPFPANSIGQPKVIALKTELHRIRPDLEIETCTDNLLTGLLNEENWAGEAQIVIDCTASLQVHTKLEYRRHCTKLKASIISMMISQETKYGVVSVSREDYSGGTADLHRKAKIKAYQDEKLRAFVDAFSPLADKNIVFQPEPGCSSPTFIGSEADSALLSGMMLNLAAKHFHPEMVHSSQSGWLHYVSQPGLPQSEHFKPFASFEWTADIIVQDPRHNYQVRIEPAAWKQMQGWIEKSKKRYGSNTETGGLLYGESNHSNRVIWINHVAGPPPDSQASSKEFICGTVGVKQKHYRLKKLSGGAIKYVGLWHTHPSSMPFPSMQDLVGMRKIFAMDQFPPALSLLLIVGTPHTQPLVGTYTFMRRENIDIWENIFSKDDVKLTTIPIER